MLSLNAPDGFSHISHSSDHLGFPVTRSFPLDPLFKVKVFQPPLLHIILKIGCGQLERVTHESEIAKLRAVLLQIDIAGDAMPSNAFQFELNLAQALQIMGRKVRPCRLRMPGPLVRNGPFEYLS